MSSKLGDMAKNLLAGLNEAVAHAKGHPTDVRTTRYEFADAKAIREKLGLSQNAFCKTYGIPLNTLQNWEQRRNNPDRTASAYLWAIAELPDQISEAQKRHHAIDASSIPAF
jgi:putative transcriptional regulator